MPCEPNLTTFSATGLNIPMTAGQIAGGFGDCSEPKATTGRLNWVLNWLTCHLLEVKTAVAVVNPCTAATATAPEIAALTGAEPMVLCIASAAKAVPINSLPFATDADLLAISPCAAPAITVAEQAALDLAPSTGKVSVCIPDGAGTKVVSVPLDSLPSAAGGGALVSAGMKTVVFDGPVWPFWYNSGVGMVSQGYGAHTFTGTPVNFTVPATGVTHVAAIFADTLSLSRASVHTVSPGDVFGIVTGNLQKNAVSIGIAAPINAIPLRDTSAPHVYPSIPFVDPSDGGGSLPPGGAGWQYGMLIGCHLV